MFKVATDPTFTHTVEVMVPINGGFDRQSFKATYRVLPRDEANAPDLGTVSGSTAFLREVVTNLDDLVDAEGQPMPYSDQLRDQLLRVPYVQAALVRTYVAAVSKAGRGKLKAAARFWATGGAGDLSEAAADAEALGLPAEIVATLTREPALFEVWPDNMTVAELWLIVSTQWRATPLADGRVHWLGLDYAAVRAGLDLAGRVASAADWAGVQLIEREAAAALNGVRG